ncbi:MAG: DEAD/DEAH box helicase [Rubripirellula sp.]
MSKPSTIKPGEHKPNETTQKTTKRKNSTAGKATATKVIDQYFDGLGWKPFRFQRSCWRAYQNGSSGILHSATGTGKTLAVWMAPILKWLRQNQDRNKWNPKRPCRARILWITPIRALAADTAASLRAPVDALGLPWEVDTRTGDSRSSAKARQLKRLPTALITTPESLSLLLTHEKILDRVDRRWS